MFVVFSETGRETDVGFFNLSYSEKHLVFWANVQWESLDPKLDPCLTTSRQANVFGSTERSRLPDCR